METLYTLAREEGVNPGAGAAYLLSFIGLALIVAAIHYMTKGKK